MSTRYMKRIYGGDAIHDIGNGSASETEIPNEPKSKSFNVFDVLNQSSDNDEQDNDDKQDEEDLKIANDCNPNSNDAKPKKKKKKRKKPENAKNQQQQQQQQHNGMECNGDVDEVERSIWEVNKLLGEPVAGCSNEILEPQWISKSKEDILIVERKHLNPYNELKKIFGSKTVQAEQSKTKARGRSGHLKKMWLVSPRDNWPPPGKFGLTMSLDHTMENNSENAQYFVYQHGSSYRQLQLKFLQAVESSIPENIISIINMHSYHVDALLQVSELCKLSEDLAMAAEFVERALYSLESAFHPSFNLATAQCRLDYRKQQNRALFITLFKHLGFVGGRACYRTSLEFCKFLLSLDHSDPLAVILSMDFYALRAREYEWFVEFCNLWESSRNLTQLPNVAYSLALAHFHLGNKAEADDLLQSALVMFPAVLMPLLEKCSIQTDAKVMHHAFFNSQAQASTPPALEKLQNLYVVRSFHLWKEADILPWLEECVHAVLNRIESKDDYVKYCEVKRRQRYRGRLPRNILRHIVLMDMKEVTVNVQEIQDDGPIVLHDPLPPADSIDIYRRPTANDRLSQNNSNLVSLFFSSLFTNIEDDIAAAAALNLFEENDDQAQ